MSIWSDIGIRSMLISTCLFAVINALVKTVPHIPFTQIVLFRAFISLSICFFLIRKRGLSLFGHNKKVLICRGLCGTAALTMFFYTLQRLPLATAVTLQYLSPLFTIFIAGFLLKEKALPIQWLGFFFAFLGVVLIRGFSSGYSDWDFMIAVGGAIASAFAYNFVRMLKDSDHELVVVFYFPLTTVPLIGPFAIAQWVWPSPLEWMILIVIGLLTQFAQLFMTISYKVARASHVAIFNYLGVVLALIIGWIFFTEKPEINALFGILLILASVILTTRLSRRVIG